MAGRKFGHLFPFEKYAYLTVNAHMMYVRPRKQIRQGFTLIELTVVMAVLGVIAVAATSVFSGRRVIASVSAKQEAELLATTLRMARLQAVASGVPQRLMVQMNGRSAIGYHTASADLVAASRLFPNAMESRWSSQVVDFLPDGTANPSLTVALSAEAGNEWTVELFSASGQVLITKTSP